MKLASIEEILELNEIKDKPKFLMAKIKGYNVAVLIGEFVVGEKCVYIPCDTLIDLSKPWFSNKKISKVYPNKIGKEYSFGIVLNLKDLPDIPDDESDLGEILGVTKYQKETILGSTYPEFDTSYIRKSDEDNLKSVPKILEEFIGLEVDITKKLDGSSMTLIWDNEIFSISSRRASLYKVDGSNILYDYTDSVTNNMISYSLPLRNLFRGKKIVIQGEFCGPKINSNRLKLTNFVWFVFTVKEFFSETLSNEINYGVTYKYYSYDEIKLLCESNNLNYVPLICNFKIDENTKIEDLQEIANNVTYSDNIGEGIVVRPKNPFLSKTLKYHNASFKLINQKYKD